MYFWFISLYLTLILNNGVAETQTSGCKNGTNEIQTFEFDHINLGHSGILIRWKPCMRTNKDQSMKSFEFKVRIKGSKNDNFSFSESYFVSSLLTRSYPYNAIASLNQYKIGSLREDTIYEVIIEQYPAASSFEELTKEIDYSLVIKTNRKTNAKPAKPDFSLQYIDGESQHNRNIVWLPCGEYKESICDGKEAGTHFAIKIRVLDRRGEYRLEEHRLDSIKMAFFVPGVPYEIKIISINGDRETESDPQEIFFKPLSSAVTSVKVTSCLNASVLLSWKPPTYMYESENIEKYFIVAMNADSFTANYPVTCARLGIYNSRLNGFMAPKIYIPELFAKSTTEKTETLFDQSVYKLRPGDTYIFSIIPVVRDGFGIEAWTNYESTKGYRKNNRSADSYRRVPDAA